MSTKKQYVRPRCEYITHPPNAKKYQCYFPKVKGGGEWYCIGHKTYLNRKKK